MFFYFRWKYEGDSRDAGLDAYIIIEGRVFMSSILVSQVISNVSATMFLSAFTEDARNILYGVNNIGGLGTPIASLASLITLKFYSHTTLAKPMKYLIYFTVVQLISLIVLIIIFNG